MRSIVGISLHANFIISFVVLFLFGLGLHIGGVAGFFVILLFMANFLTALFIILVTLNISVFKVPREFHFIAVVSLCAIVYFVAWILGGLSAGQHVKDVLGGALRAIVPFLVFLSFTFAFNKAANKEGLLRFMLHLLLFYGFVFAGGKIVLLATGSFYGAGLNQYIVSAFIVSFLFALLQGGGGRKLCWLALFCLLLLSVLSFKRTVWVQLLFIVSIFIYFLPGVRKFNFSIMLLAVLVGVVFVSSDTAIAERIISRFLYTFSGDDGGLDQSTGRRIVELQGMYAHYLDNYPWLTFWVGHGPGAGFDLISMGYENRNTNEFGEAYHIHSFWGIVFFRFGIVGLLLYVLPIGWAIFRGYKIVRQSLSMVTSSTYMPFWCLVAALGSYIELILLSVSTASANAFYASYSFGLVLFFVCAVSFLLSPSRNCVEDRIVWEAECRTL